MLEAQDSVSVPESLEVEEEFYQGPIVDRIDLYIDRTVEGEDRSNSVKSNARAMSLLHVDYSS